MIRYGGSARGSVKCSRKGTPNTENHCSTLEDGGSIELGLPPHTESVYDRGGLFLVAYLHRWGDMMSVYATTFWQYAGAIAFVGGGLLAGAAIAGMLCALTGASTDSQTVSRDTGYRIGGQPVTQQSSEMSAGGCLTVFLTLAGGGVGFYLALISGCGK